MSFKDRLAQAPTQPPVIDFEKEVTEAAHEIFDHLGLTEWGPRPVTPSIVGSMRRYKNISNMFGDDREVCGVYWVDVGNGYRMDITIKAIRVGQKANIECEDVLFRPHTSDRMWKTLEDTFIAIKQARAYKAT